LRPDSPIIRSDGPARRHYFVVVWSIHNPHDGTPSTNVFG
jgi:hypothetical protein